MAGQKKYIDRGNNIKALYAQNVDFMHIKHGMDVVDPRLLLSHPLQYFYLCWIQKIWSKIENKCETKGRKRKQKSHTT